MAKKKKQDDAPAADAEVTEGGGGGAAKSSKIVPIAAVLAMAFAGYGAFLKPAPTAAPAPTAMAFEEAAPAEGAIHELEEMVINLAGGDVTYLRVGIAIVLTEEEDPAMFEADQAIAKDVVIELLGTKESADFEAGPARQAVKQQLTDAMVEAYGDERVVRVLFTGLVMQ